ncbi:MAG TPA: vanadium-dependent haloperoxidase [Gaiellaceae bacterium]|nr:vanadium-dependent haloperoxidase [Gaiellaceae bacterium]
MNVRGLLAVLAMLTILVPSAAVEVASSTPTPANQALLDWNAIGVQTMISPPAGTTLPTFQTEGLIYMSYLQAAVYDAVTAIEGGYQPYKVSLSPPAGATAQAATIGAAYEILGTYFPSHKVPRLDAAYTASVATLPTGAADPGLAFGKEVADDLIAIRSTDGRNGSNAWYSFPSAGPGAWSVPTADNVAARTATPQTPWVAHMTPFLLQSASQFRADPPPSLTSPEYAAGLNEVKAYGGQNADTLRTTAQANVARFWTANTITQYNTLFRSLAATRSVEDTARLLAMGNMVATDSAIACFDSKYAYSFWRPIQAIRAAGTDGNPATTADPNWTPFLAPTPNHPEYPSAHGCVTGSIANLLPDLLGTNRINVAMPGLNPATNAFDPNYTRTFAKVNDMTRDIADARVWAGYHYRESVVQGVNIGRKTEHYAVKHYFLPTG